MTKPQIVQFGKYPATPAPVQFGKIPETDHTETVEPDSPHNGGIVPEYAGGSPVPADDDDDGDATGEN